MLPFLIAATPIFGFSLTPPELPAPAAVAEVAFAEMAVAGAAAAEAERNEHAETLARRQRMRPWHIAFGNLAWGATTISTVLGILLYRDRFGRFDDEGDTPCARGDAIFAGSCDGLPAGHSVTVGVLWASFAASFSIGLAMPDPLAMDEGDGKLAKRLRRHKALRWVLLGMLVVQTALGAVSVNLDDFESRRALATVHMGLGSAMWATMLAMGTYGSLMAY